VSARDSRLDPAAVEGRGQPLPRVARLSEHHDGERRVGGHVRADHRNSGRQQLPIGAVRSESGAVLSLGDDVHGPIRRDRLHGQGRGDDRRGGNPRCRDDLDAVFGVEAHHRPTTAFGGEQRQLRAEVGAHVAEVVEMVVREVGEARDIEDDPVDAVTCQCLRADFVGHRLHSALAHVREQSVELGRLQNRLEEMCDARLVVRSRDAEHDRHVLLRAVDPGRDLAEDAARIVHHGDRHAGVG